MAVDAKEAAEKYESGGQLSDEERRFLQDRGVSLDEPVPVVFNLANGTQVSNDPIAVLQNMQEQNKVDMEEEIARRVQAELDRRLAGAVTEAQHAQIVADTPHTGTANTHDPDGRLTTPPDAEDAEDAEDDEEGVEEDSEDAGDEDYEDGWNNDTRRAELARRGLSVEGNKEQLISRLKESDVEESEEE